MSFLLFLQHGWADNHRGMLRLASLLGAPVVIAPDLGWWNTWWRIEPLIEKVHAVVTKTIDTHPDRRWRIIGHSMGGLIWLELLDRFPEWWQYIDNLVLIGSPVGGSEISRIIDPCRLGIGIARDLAVNRRPIAEKIAAEIPTLSIAGDLFAGLDGVVTTRSTQFNHAQLVTFPNIYHPDLRCDRGVITSIQNFWQKHEDLNPEAQSVIN